MSPPPTFGHIYFDDWNVGSKCQHKVDGAVIEMGTLVAKKLSGRANDPDIELTFEKDGKQYEHTMEFDNSYRQY
jgi:hypothetical protein